MRVLLTKASFLFFFSGFFIVGCNKTKNNSVSVNSTEISHEEKVFNNCLENLNKDVEKLITQTNSNYTLIDGPNAVVAPHKSTRFLKGKFDKGAVLVFHGILSTPDDVSKLTEQLNAQGFTVLAPLMTGFGSTIKVANSSRLALWQRNVDLHYVLLSKCFDHIALAGFSMGGGLSTDFILNRYPSYQKEKGFAQISSLLLLSPAIMPSEWFPRVKAAVTLPFTDAVPFWLISKLKDDPEIKEMMKEPQKYNQYFPVHVGLSLVDLADTLEKSPERFDTHSLHVSLDYSQSDTATDWVKTREFLTDRFFDVRIFSYTKTQNVPHSLFLNADSDIGHQIRSGMVRFVNWYMQKSIHDH